MIKKKFAAPAAIVSILLAIGGLAGCAKQAEIETAKTTNANQSQMNSNSGNVTVLSNAAPPAIENNNSAVNNNSTTAGNSNNSGRDAARPQTPVREPTPVIGGGGNDFSLLVQARGALSADKDLINAVVVEIKDGNVTLNGSVANEAQKIKAGQLVQNVKGIKSVKNNLRVAS